MKIALFSDTYVPQLNGVATATKALRDIFLKNGHEVLVITTCLDNQKNVILEDGVLRIPGVTMKHIYNYKLGRIYSKKAFNIIKKFSPDVIHVQTEMSICIFGRYIAKKLRIPLIYTYHTLYEDYTYYVTLGIKPIDNIAKKMVGTVSTLISDNTTEFTTTSNKAKDILVKYGVKKYINVIPIGIDFSLYYKENVDFSKVEEIKSKYNLKDKFTLIILGRIAKEKNNSLILNYLSNFLQEHSEFKSKLKLLVVGDGPDKINLENLTDELKLNDIVDFVGPVKHEEVPYYYYASNLFVSASTSETQGLTFNEAMASNLLVLAKYDRNLEGCIIDNKTGFFYHDLDSFKTKLLQIYNINEKEKETITKDAYKNNIEKYSLDIFYKRMKHVYEKAIKKYW